MARPIKYDKDEVLDNAMRLFWIKGFEATSMAELLQATGLTSRSLYNIFGSKNGIFKEALLRYYEIGYRLPFDELCNGSGLKSIRKYVETVTSAKGLNGCFFVNTISDQNAIEPDGLEIVQNFFSKLEGEFRSRFKEAKKEGYIGDPRVRASQLVIMLQGFGIYSKSATKRSEIGKLANDFLKTIGI